MDLSSLTNAAPSAQSLLQGDPANQEESQDVMGKDDFLQLLVTQLKTQDPMNPMEDQEFAAQLAQFSSLEQLMNLNESFSNQSAISERLNSSMAADLLGKEVQTMGNAIEWTGDGEVPLSFNLDSPASDVKIVVHDSTGQSVFEQDVGSLNDGFHEFAWDGMDADGNEVPNGSYTFSVEAIGSDGESVEVSPFVNGTVDRVTFGSGGPMLQIDGREVPMNQVRSIENR